MLCASSNLRNLRRAPDRFAIDVAPSVMCFATLNCKVLYQHWMTVTPRLMLDGENLNFRALHLPLQLHLAYHAVFHSSFRMKQATCKSTIDVAVRNGKMYSEPRQSRCLSSPWLEFQRSSNQLAGDTRRRQWTFGQWRPCCHFRLNRNDEKKVCLCGQNAFLMLATTFFFYPICPLAVHLVYSFSVLQRTAWSETRRSVWLALLFNAEWLWWREPSNGCTIFSKGGWWPVIKVLQADSVTFWSSLPNNGYFIIANTTIQIKTEMTENED